jgi:hypothetical protein
VYVSISPPVSTVSSVIVQSFAGDVPPSCVPNTVTVFPTENPDPVTENAAL